MSTESETDRDAQDTGHRSSGRQLARWVVGLLAVVGAISLVALLVGGVELWSRLRDGADGRGENTDYGTFYATVEDPPAEMGTIVRSEPLGYAVPGGEGHRIVYTSEDSAGDPIAVSGMIFVPDSVAPPAGRNVVAYAHGTAGIATKCAPSRAAELDSLSFTTSLLPALERGWVVVATDYQGLGIPGPATYLVGDQEARDVVASVLAARAFEGAEAGTDWIVWGSSQGGNSSLWTAHLAAEIAPELSLMGAMAAAPAARLGAGVNANWDSVDGWALGPPVIKSWSEAYPDRDFETVLSGTARRRLGLLTSECTLTDGLLGLTENALGSRFFVSNPVDDQDWAHALKEQSAPLPPPTMPVLVVQGTADKIIPAGANAGLVQDWCDSGVDLTTLWLGGVSHLDALVAGGPFAVEWAGARFTGEPAQSNCDSGVPPMVKVLEDPLAD
ncbi:MAG: hypothetical protein GY812_03690 [Actinomycetia bacterium]|nr:hypothetical protein [Actinomycetes bacterium]